MTSEQADFWRLVPTDVAANAQFRRQLLTLGYEDAEARREQWIMCARDPIFFICGFTWLLEARDPSEWQVENVLSLKEKPFILRDYQNGVVSQILKHLGQRTIIVEKSRETGVTWILIALAIWDTMFHGQTHVGLVSKDESSVDSTDNPDSLFSKLEFLYKRLPYWLRQPIKRNLSEHTWKYLDNESTITGYASTGDLARGGRKRWMLMDEFHAFPSGIDKAALDSTSAVTPCRVVISTPNRHRGAAGAYYDLVTDDTHNGVRIVVDWKDDIEKRRGLYHSEHPEGSEAFQLVIDDAEFWSRYANGDGTYRNPTNESEQYKFSLDGRTRSPYYDDFCRIPGMTLRGVSAELDRNFAGATSTVCDIDLLRRAVELAKKPMIMGDVYEVAASEGGWKFDTSIPDGNTRLWCLLDANGNPPKSEYSAGVDISAGKGGALSSYSAIEIIDKRTGEHVLELRSNRLDPQRFAHLAAWVCEWFHGAYMVPERNGIGEQFIEELIRMRYTGVVYKEKKRGRRNVAPTENLGYWSNGPLDLLGPAETAIRLKKLHVNSALALREMMRYFYGDNGQIKHSSVEAEEDGSGKGKSHGDAAIALCVAWHGVEDWPASTPTKNPEAVPIGSFMHRRLEWEKSQKAKSAKAYWAPY